MVRRNGRTDWPKSPANCSAWERTPTANTIGTGIPSFRAPRLGRSIAMGHIALAEVLLESGANPTDGVSTHIAAGSGNFPHWNCFIALASTSTEFQEGFLRSATF